MTDIAVMNAGGISVPIFTTYSSSDYEYILNEFSDDYDMSIDPKARQSLRVSMQKGLSFEKTKDLVSVYDVIKKNRSFKGFPLNMKKADIEKTASERSRVATALLELGYKIAPSLGNFLFFDSRAPSGILADALLRKGTVVKPWKQAGFDTFLRVSIGSAADNDKFIADLRACSNNAD